jgi:hypothetical protein
MSHTSILTYNLFIHELGLQGRNPSSLTQADGIYSADHHGPHRPGPGHDPLAHLLVPSWARLLKKPDIAVP